MPAPPSSRSSPMPPLQEIVAAAAEQGVVAVLPRRKSWSVAAVEQVVAAEPEQAVIAAEAEDLVVAGGAADEVVARSAGKDGHIMILP